MAFMFESRYLLRPTRFAMETEALQADYRDCWRGLHRRFSA
jgi:homogentisate 1,2-dioxygenase